MYLTLYPKCFDRFADVCPVPGTWFGIMVRLNYNIILFDETIASFMRI